MKKEVVSVANNEALHMAYAHCRELVADIGRKVHGCGGIRLA